MPRTDLTTDALIPSSLNESDSSTNAVAVLITEQRVNGSSITAYDKLRAAKAAVTSRLDAACDVDELIRLAAAVMVERCVAEFDRRSDVTGGWLVAALKSGGAWASLERAAVAEVPASRFAAYDRAAGL